MTEWGMTSSEWAELACLAQKAAHHERDTYGNENNYEQLRAVASYAGRMA